MTVRRRPLAAALVAAAFFLVAQAAWIPAKAWLGQVLLERAWQQRLAGNDRARPWPWADTAPVGRLDIPRLELSQLVLEGASGRNLAWGPAALTPLDGEDVVLSGHRDTHFGALRHLRVGDRIVLWNGSARRAYRVAWLDIVDSRYQELVTRRDRERLTLVTCYPFDAPTAGGPLRLVVTALPEETPAALADRARAAVPQDPRRTAASP